MHCGESDALLSFDIFYVPHKSYTTTGTLREQVNVVFLLHVTIHTYICMHAGQCDALLASDIFHVPQKPYTTIGTSQEQIKHCVYHTSAHEVSSLAYIHMLTCQCTSYCCIHAEDCVHAGQCMLYSWTHVLSSCKPMMCSILHNVLLQKES